MKTKTETALLIVAGDCGVYVGFGLIESIGADGRAVLVGARHLRRYYVAGGGDGAAGELAAKGIDLRHEGSSVTAPVAGKTLLLGVRRAFEVDAAVASSFGCTPT